MASTTTSDFSLFQGYLDQTIKNLHHIDRRLADFWRDLHSMLPRDGTPVNKAEITTRMKDLSWTNEKERTSLFMAIEEKFITGYAKLSLNGIVESNSKGGYIYRILPGKYNPPGAVRGSYSKYFRASADPEVLLRKLRVEPVRSNEFLTSSNLTPMQKRFFSDLQEILTPVGRRGAMPFGDAVTALGRKGDWKAGVATDLITELEHKKRVRRESQVQHGDERRNAVTVLYVIDPEEEFTTRYHQRGDRDGDPRNGGAEQSYHHQQQQQNMTNENRHDDSRVVQEFKQRLVSNNFVQKYFGGKETMLMISLCRYFVKKSDADRGNKTSTPWFRRYYGKWNIQQAILDDLKPAVRTIEEVGEMMRNLQRKDVLSEMLMSQNTHPDHASICIAPIFLEKLGLIPSASSPSGETHHHHHQNNQHNQQQQPQYSGSYIREGTELVSGRRRERSISPNPRQQYSAASSASPGIAIPPQQQQQQQQYQQQQYYHQPQPAQSNNNTSNHLHFPQIPDLYSQNNNNITTQSNNNSGGNNYNSVAVNNHHSNQNSSDFSQVMMPRQAQAVGPSSTSTTNNGNSSGSTVVHQIIQQRIIIRPTATGSSCLRLPPPMFVERGSSVWRPVLSKLMMAPPPMTVTREEF